MADLAHEALARAWEQSFVDTGSSRVEALRALDSAPAGSLDAAWAFWLLALAEARAAASQSARARLQPARLLFTQHADARGQAMCDELEAVIALYAGDSARAEQIHAAIDTAPSNDLQPLDRFLAAHTRCLRLALDLHRERAAQLAQVALHHAQAANHLGAQANALVSLAFAHQALFDLERAAQYGHAAVDLARACGARGLITQAGADLIVTHHAAGQSSRALEVAEFLIENPHLQSPAALTRAAVPLALAYFAEGEFERTEAWLEGGSHPAGPAQADNSLLWAWLSARCLMQRSEFALALGLAQRTLSAAPGAELEFHRMKLEQTAADACAALGDSSSAQQHQKRAQQLHLRLKQMAAAARANSAVSAAPARPPGALHCSPGASAPSENSRARSAESLG